MAEAEKNKKRVTYTVFPGGPDTDVEKMTGEVLNWLDEMRRMYPKKSPPSKKE